MAIQRRFQDFLPVCTLYNSLYICIKIFCKFLGHAKINTFLLINTVLLGTARSFGNPHAPPVTSAIGSNFPGMIQGPAFFPGAGGLVGFGQQPNVLSSIPPNLLQSPLNPPMHHFNSAQLQQIMAAMGAPQQNCPGAQTQAAQMAQQVGQNAVNGLPLFINAGLPGTNSSPAMPGATDMATAEFMMYNLQQQQLQQQQQNQLLAQFPLMAAAAAASLPVFSQPPSTTMSGQAMPKSMMNPSQASIVNGIMTRFVFEM